MQRATQEERHRAGQAIRKQITRQVHAAFTAKDRQVYPLELLQRSAKGRVPALVKLKYERMMASPFGYFRGAVPVMAADLAGQPDTGLSVQLCGDAHVRNLGAYEAEDGRLIFDINDFDETIRGPFEWDLKRMAASLVVAGREAGNKDGCCGRAVVRCISSYCQMMRGYAPMPVLEMVRHQVSRFDEIQPVHAALEKALRATPLHTLEQLTEPVPGSGGHAAGDATAGKTATKKAAHKLAKKAAKKEAKTGAQAHSSGKANAKAGDAHAAAQGNVGGPRQFREMKPVLTRVSGARREAVLESLKAYRETLQSQRQIFLDQYTAIDVAFKVVGTGSVGLRDYCVYLEGNGAGDPLFLQVKEEAASAYAAYLPQAHAPQQQGQRVVEGQRLIQTGTDILLGYTRMAGRDYLVRQLSDHKASIELTDLDGDGLIAYAQLCGELLARGHARSGDAQQISGYVGSGDGFAEALARYGRAYADQTDVDWAELKRAHGQG